MNITFKRFLEYMVSLIATNVYIAAQYILYKATIDDCSRLNIGAVAFFIGLSLISFTLLILTYHKMNILKFKTM